MVPPSPALNLPCDFLDLSFFVFKKQMFGANALKDPFRLFSDMLLLQSVPRLLTSLSKMLSTLFHSYSVFRKKGQFFPADA